jgi:hypothetical protein
MVRPMKDAATGKGIPGLDYELSRDEATELVRGDPERAIFLLLQLSSSPRCTMLYLDRHLDFGSLSS